MNKSLKVKNDFGDNLDVMVSGNENSDKVIVFVHGLGSNKNEGYNLFADIAEALANDALLVRFDISGFGQSEGAQEDFCLSKATNDLKCILDFTGKNFKQPVQIIAHSFGGYVTSNLNPHNVGKIIFTSSPRPDTSALVKALQDRIQAKGTLDVNGVSIYHRSSGEIQKIGEDFWKDLAMFDSLQALANLKNRENLTIFCGLQDDIVKVQSGDLYRDLKITYHEINGDHDYKNPDDRAHLIALIKNTLN